MHSSSHPSVPLRPRRFDMSRRTSTAAAAKPQGSGFRREDKNMNTIPTSSPRRLTKGPTETTRARVGVQTRAPVGPSRLALQKRSATPSSLAKPKPKNVRAPVAAKVAPPPPPPLPPLVLDPNCNEPSLPCLCCDGRSPQEHNSMFNHNHNNNNTVSIRQQLKLQPPPPPPPLRLEPTRAKAVSSSTLPQLQPAACPAAALEEEENLKSVDVDNKPDKKAVEENEEQERSVENEIDGDVDDDYDEDDDDDDDDDSDDDEDDDDTLVPSCCDCPPSLLDLSLTSSTSSSSTSISSCSDLESDCADLSNCLCSSQDHDDLSISSHDLLQAPECYPSSRSLPSLPLDPNPPASDPRSPPPPCSPDEGYPSAPASPSSDYLHVKGQMGHLGSEVTKFGLLDFLESIGEFGKMERFSQVIQVARWDLDGDQQWDLLRFRLDHLDHLEKVNRQVKLAHIARLHEKGLDLGEMEGEDLSDVLDEMGNIDIPWKLYKGRGGTLGDSQEFSDAGVDLSAPSDCDEPLAPESLTPSPVEPPPRPPKPPARFASVNSDLHTYINISRETTSMAVCTSPSPTFSTFSPSSSSPTFSTFRCERALPPSPPSIPPLPVSQPMPYFTLYTAPLLTLPSSAPPIPPPRKRHLARKEAQRLTALQAQQEKTPLSLPPPTIRPPPLPPPPVVTVSSSSPPALPPPPALLPPPSFHALDVEIRKLLMLAGVTQAELLKLSPELGDCVGGLENGEKEGLHIAKQTASQHVKRREESTEQKESNMESVADDGWTVRGVLDRDRRMEILGVEDKGEKDESRDVFRTTSFTEMARRRKRTSGLASDTYYSNTAETFKYSPPPAESPPPPPPRPLPPIPPSLPPLKVCTLSDNLARPERFDWLMAFTPDGESLPLPPPLVMRKSSVETPKRLTTSSSGSSSGSGSGSKVTTFKEIRNRGKNCSPPTRVITDPEPDPNVITPDPDILYNLKWRREKVEDDGIQWEYTSQAQAVFMNPPPLTSFAAFREMFQKAEDDRQQAEARPAQQIGCSSSDSNLWSSGEDRTCKRNEEGEKEEELEVVRGRADGGRTLESRTAAVRSVSFAGSTQREGNSWMGDDEQIPMRGLGLSSLCLQEKRALVSAVSVAVEAILTQFSASRTVVQKTLSGDSSLNPSLGRLVLQCLCPALHNLLSDGLKPHQSDLIAGRRPNSAWGLVQASTRPGPDTQSLYNLQLKVRGLAQLKQSKHRFNAFLLGLLNIKKLDVWLSHLQSCNDVLETYYRPSAFMRLSFSTCQHLFEELILLLQPLSLLTFNLDLLFQHHHLEPVNHSPEIRSPPNPGLGVRLSPRGSASSSRGSSYLESLSEVDFGSPEPEVTNRKASSLSPDKPKAAGLVEASSSNAAPMKTSPQLLWVQEKEMSEIAPPCVEEASLTHQAGQVLQQGWGAVVRLGGRLSQNLSDLSMSAGPRPDGPSSDLPELQTQSDFPRVDSCAGVPFGLGRLFGASKYPNNPTSHSSRRPSQWLTPGVTALTRMVSSSSTPKLQRALQPQAESEAEMEREVETMENRDKAKPLRSVRTLCDHSGTGAELSFQKGEELVILGSVDQDWIRCRQGDKEGLVPIGYASLIM